MKRDAVFTLETRSDGSDFDALWNGIRIHEDFSGQAKIAQVKLNPYVIEGDNSIAVTVAAHPPRTPSFRLRILEGAWGQADTERELTRYDWAAADRGGTPAWSGHVAIAEAFGRWSWEDAEAGRLTDVDRPALEALIGRLHAAVERRDIAEITRLFSIKNQEMSRALDIPEEELVGDMQAMFGRFWSAPQWRLDPLDHGKLDFVSAAGGRLVTVTQAGEAVLRGHSGAVGLRVQVTAARLGGAWTILR